MKNLKYRLFLAKAGVCTKMKDKIYRLAEEEDDSDSDDDFGGDDEEGEEDEE